MDIFDKKMIIFLEAMKDNAVRFIMVAGYDYNTTINSDQGNLPDQHIWIDDTPGNRINFKKAVEDGGTSDHFIRETLESISGWSDLRLTRGRKLDIMIQKNEPGGCSFEECYHLATIIKTGKINIPLLHMSQLNIKKNEVSCQEEQINTKVPEKIRLLLRDMGMNIRLIEERTIN